MERISTKQLAVLIIFTTVGDMLLVLPPTIANVVKQDSWLAGLFGLAAAIPITWVIYAFGKSLSGTGLVELNRRLLGRWAGGLLSAVFLLFFLFNCALMIREASDFLTTQLFPETPLRAIHVLTIFALMVGVKYGLQTIARTGEIFFPIFTFLYLALVFFLSPQIKTERLHPIMASGVPTLLHGTLHAAVFPFCELVVIVMIMPYLARNKHLPRDFALAVAIGGIGSFLIILLAILVLGGEKTAFYDYPSYILAQKISVGHFLERLEALLAVNLILSTYVKTVLYFFAFATGTAQWLKLRDYRSIVVPTAMILFGLAYFVSPNVVYYSRIIMNYWVDVDVLIGFVFPLLLLLLFKWRTRRGKRMSPFKAPKA